MSVRYLSTQMSLCNTALLSALGLAFSFSPTTHALFSSSFDTPHQCEELEISFQGDYTLPISYLIIPYNSSAPYTIIADYERDYNRTSTRIPQFSLPAGTEFTITLSDASGFGTGGTSEIKKVKSGSSDGCFDEADTSSIIHKDSRIATTCEWIHFAVSADSTTDPYSYYSGSTTDSYSNYAGSSDDMLLEDEKYSHSFYAVSPATLPREIAKNITSSDGQVAYQVTEPKGTRVGFVGVRETSSYYDRISTSAMQEVQLGSDTSCSKPPEASPTPSPTSRYGNLSNSEFGGVVFGIIAGVFLVILGLIGGIWYTRRYKRRLLASRAQEVDLVGNSEGQDLDGQSVFEPTPYMRQTALSNKTGSTYAHSESELLPLSPTENNATSSSYAQKRALSHLVAATETRNATSSTQPSQSTLNSRNAVYHSDAGPFLDERTDAEDEEHVPPPYVERLGGHSAK